MTLTNQELAETATALLAQLDRADLRVTYEGNGWFHRKLLHSNASTAMKERRKDVEKTIASLHERIKREAEERPEKERKAREEEASRRLHKATPKLLEVVRKVATMATHRHVGDPFLSATIEEARAALKQAMEG